VEASDLRSRARMHEDAARAFDELVVFGSKVFGTCHFSRRNGSEPRNDTAIRSRRHSFVGGCAGDRDLIYVRKGSLEPVLPNRSTCLGQAKCVARGHFRRRVIRPISPICTGGVLTEAPDSVPPVSTLATSIGLRTNADILCHGAPLAVRRDDLHRCRRSRCGGTVFPKPCV